MPLVALSSRRLEPALCARGVEAHRLTESPEASPQAWLGRLLELAARLEPRPFVWPGSLTALDFLRRAAPQLSLHYELLGIDAFDRLGSDEFDSDPDAALRSALERDAAALEVQVVLDGRGERTGACVLAWALAAAPDVIVTSVESEAILRRSGHWLQSRRHSGYARLVWSPGVQGRLELRAASGLPGTTLALAQADGVDLPALAYAAAAGFQLESQRARCNLTRKFALVESPAGCDTPILTSGMAFSLRDPLPWIAGCLRSLLRS